MELATMNSLTCE